MCKACYSTPQWNEIHYKRQGAVDPDDFYKEVNYRPKAKAKKAKKRYPGCPGNDKGPHVYMWTTEKNREDLFFDYYGFHKHEKKVCVGCGHVDKSRTTAEYDERNSKEKDKAYRKGRHVWNFWGFENYDEEYRAVRAAYIKRRGWDEYAYGGWW